MKLEQGNGGNFAKSSKSSPSIAWIIHTCIDCRLITSACNLSPTYPSALSPTHLLRRLLVFDFTLVVGRIVHLINI